MTDTDALQRYARRRDPDAFAHLVVNYQQMVYAVCLRRLGNEADARDAAQDTFVKLARSADAIQESVVGWLHRCATTTSLDLIRGESRRRDREQRVDAAVGASAHAAPHDPAWAEVRAALDDTLDELPAEQRDLVVQRYLAGRKQADLAAEAGVSESLMSRRVHAAVDELRQRLHGKGFAVGLGALTAGFAAESAVALPVGLPASLTGLGTTSATAAAATATTGSAAAAGQPAASLGWLWLGTKIKLSTAILGSLAIHGAILGVYLLASGNDSPPLPASAPGARPAGTPSPPSATPTTGTETFGVGQLVRVAGVETPEPGAAVPPPAPGRTAGRADDAFFPESQGEWIGVEVDNVAIERRLTIDGNDMDLQSNPGPETYTLQITSVDRESNPNRFEAVIRESPVERFKGASVRSIFELKADEDGQQLTYASYAPNAAPYPENFEPGDGARVFRFRRPADRRAGVRVADAAAAPEQTRRQPPAPPDDDPSGYVYVTGGTPRPGAYTLPGDEELTLVQLLATAGGVDPIDGRAISITRRGEDNDGEAASQVVLQTTLRDIFDGPSGHTVLQAGDLVRIDEPAAAEAAADIEASVLDPALTGEWLLRVEDRQGNLVPGNVDALAYNARMTFRGDEIVIHPHQGGRIRLQLSSERDGAGELRWFQTVLEAPADVPALAEDLNVIKPLQFVDHRVEGNRVYAPIQSQNPQTGRLETIPAGEFDRAGHRQFLVRPDADPLRGEPAGSAPDAEGWRTAKLFDIDQAAVDRPKFIDFDSGRVMAAPKGLRTSPHPGLFRFVEQEGIDFCVDLVTEDRLDRVLMYHRPGGDGRFVGMDSFRELEVSANDLPFSATLTTAEGGQVEVVLEAIDVANRAIDIRYALMRGADQDRAEASRTAVPPELIGVWRGQGQAGDQRADGLRLTVDRFPPHRMALTDAGGTNVFMLADIAGVDLEARPARLDVRPVAVRGGEYTRDQPFPTIFELDGDTLRWSFFDRGDAYPLAFGVPDAELYEMRRVGDDMNEADPASDSIDETRAGGIGQAIDSAADVDGNFLTTANDSEPAADEFAYVMGRVRNPGAYRVRRGQRLSLLQLIASAGGATESDPAKVRVTLIRRVEPSREETLFDGSLAELLRGGRTVIGLRGDDLVNVGVAEAKRQGEPPPVLKISTQPSDERGIAEAAYGPEGHVEFENYAVRDIAVMAYGMPGNYRMEWEVEPPPGRFDADLPDPDWQQILREAMREQFGLTGEIVQRPFTVYALRLSEDGEHRLRETVEEGGRFTSKPDTHSWTASQQLQGLTTNMEYWLDSPVRDETGLEGRYDFTLNVARDASPEVMAAAVRRDLGLEMVDLGEEVLPVVVMSREK